jgi:hypothetical protein
MPLYWLCYRGMDCGMTQVSKVALLLFLLLFSVTTNAQTCVKVDYDNSPAAIVSGRITTHHKLPKGSEQRTGDGPWLILDEPLLLGWYECAKWRKIAILTGDQSQIDQSQIRSWDGQHVTIDGKLGRFVSALVSPSIYIEITTIKKD